MRQLYAISIMLICAAGYSFEDPGTPVFDPIAPLCQCAPAPALQTVSTNGYSGTWSPAVIDSCTPGAYPYTFTPDSGQDAVAVTIIIFVYQTPGAPIVSDYQFCQNSPATMLSATGSNLLWYASATGSVGNGIAPTPSTFTPGSFTYYVSQTDNGCESPRAAVTVTVLATPAAPIVSSAITYCVGDTASALTAAGSNLIWYSGASGGIGNSTAPIPTTSSPGSTVYYVSQTLNGCESARAPIVVTVNALQPLNLACNGASVPSSLGFDWSNASGASGYNFSYTIDNGAPVTGTQMSPSSYTITGLSAGQSVTFTVTAIGIPCAESTVTCTTLRNDEFSRETFHMTPNPVHDILYFEGSFTGNAGIFNLAGCLIESRRITPKDTSIDMTGVAAGMYLLRMESGQRVETFHIVKAD